MDDQTQPIRFGDGPPAPPPPLDTPRRPRRWLLAAGAALVGLAAGCCGGFGIATTTQPEPKTVVVNSPSPYKVTEYVTVAPSAPASPAAPTKAPIPIIEDGIWLVGTDFPAGTYRTMEAVTDCYWAIYRADTNQDVIINNDIVRGGRPTVKLSKGQEFKSNDCGFWEKIK